MGTDDILDKKYLDINGNPVEDRNRAVIFYKIYQKEGWSFLNDPRTYAEINLYGNLEEVKEAARRSIVIDKNVRERILKLEKLIERTFITLSSF